MAEFGQGGLLQVTDASSGAEVNRAPSLHFQGCVFLIYVFLLSAEAFLTDTYYIVYYAMPAVFEESPAT